MHKIDNKHRIFSKLKRANNRGFSLLELVLAITLFSLGSFATSYLIIDANTASRNVFENREALTHARNGIEALMGLRNATTSSIISCNNPCGINTSSSVWSMNASPTTHNSGKYTRSVNIDYMPDFANNLDSTDTFASTSVTVTWTNPRNVQESITLSTYLTNWRYERPVVEEVEEGGGE